MGIIKNFITEYISFLMLGDNRIEEVEAEYIPPRSQTGLTSGTDKEF